MENSCKLTPPVLPPSSSSSTRVSRETVGRAVDSLLNWMQEQSKRKMAQLLEHDDIIQLLLSLKKIPQQGRLNPYLIPLPHPLLPLEDPSLTICLFLDDRPSAPITPQAAQDKIKADSIPISEVITLSDLRSDYHPYEARRRLLGSYDRFFADCRILHLLPRLLGKHFFKKKRQPIGLNLTHKNWKEQLRHCCSSTTLYLRTGTTCQLNVGRSLQERDEIVENVIAAIEGAVERIPKKWSNVRALYLKTDESVALPIYQAVPEIGFKIDGYLKKKEEVMLPEGDEKGPINGEVVQPSEEEQKKLRSKKGSHKGKIREVRYMDNNLDEGDFMLSNLPGDDVNVDGELEGNDESDGEKKEAKLKKKGSQASSEGACVINGVNKRKGKAKKLDDKETKIKNNKKSKIRHETD